MLEQKEWAKPTLFVDVKQNVKIGKSRFFMSKVTDIVTGLALPLAEELGLELTQEAKEDWVSYRFTFREADSDGEIPL